MERSRVYKPHGCFCSFLRVDWMAHQYFGRPSNLEKLGHFRHCISHFKGWMKPMSFLLLCCSKESVHVFKASVQQWLRDNCGWLSEAQRGARHALPPFFLWFRSAPSHCSNTKSNSHNALILANYEKLAGWEMRCHLRTSAGPGVVLCAFMIYDHFLVELFFPPPFQFLHHCGGRAGMGWRAGTALNCKFGRLIYLITGLTFRQFLIIPRILAAGNEM